MGTVKRRCFNFSADWRVKYVDVQTNAVVSMAPMKFDKPVPATVAIRMAVRMYGALPYDVEPVGMQQEQLDSHRSYEIELCETERTSICGMNFLHSLPEGTRVHCDALGQNFKVVHDGIRWEGGYAELWHWNGTSDNQQETGRGDWRLLDWVRKVCLDTVQVIT